MARAAPGRARALVARECECEDVLLAVVGHVSLTAHPELHLHDRAEKGLARRVLLAAGRAARHGARRLRVRRPDLEIGREIGERQSFREGVGLRKRREAERGLLLVHLLALVLGLLGGVRRRVLVLAEVFGDGRRLDRA